ncbi:unnamed protein product [Dicrocoelium dendriticum]|nr:unnamed protein product [Dicrocoelium dendriticum]
MRHILLRPVAVYFDRLILVSKRNAVSVLSPLEKKYYPHIGNREIVGFGRNGVPMYADDPAFPYPSIRFQNHTDEIEALRKKEAGPWSQLTVDEVKRLYRHSFCRTLEETVAPSTLWRLGIAWGLFVCSVGALAFAYIRTFVLKAPKNVAQLPEYKEAIKYKQVFSRGGPMQEVVQFDVKTKRFRE